MVSDAKIQPGEEALTPEDITPDYAKERNALLKDIPLPTIRRAWFTLAHLLVPDGSHVIDMGTGDGTLAYSMAVLNPKIKITAVDKNKRLINRAKELYVRPNLEFVSGDASTGIFPENAVDAIINSYILHEVYSGSRYNERIVSDTLHQHFKMLKTDGIMFIRDYARPPPEEFVLMEMKDLPSRSDKLADLSEADLLVWYSEHARPRQDPGCGGFFLEELPPRIPRTRLFRLPYKWAYEFIMRKDNRERWETELPMEYTFFTMREFRKEMRSLGARLEYSAPFWDEDIIEKKFEGRFRLFEDDGTPIGDPPTCFLAVARKMNERKSLYIEERRPAPEGESDLRVFAMRDNKTGALVDLVTRDEELAEIIPYRVDEDGRLKVFLHYGVARAIANAVQRSGVNIDGKRWSGHMVEPIGVNLDVIHRLDDINPKSTALFARDHLGLKPFDNAVLEHGNDYYPAPDFIDEQIHTYYLNVVSPQKYIQPKAFTGNSARFQARGQIRELDAQIVLNAITVGYVPSGRLEMQILNLFDHLGIQAETWTNKEVAVKAGEISGSTKISQMLKQLEESSNRFKPVQGTAGQLRMVHSMFVEEGQSQGAAMGLSSSDIDFAIRNDKTINVAVVLPLTKGTKEDFHAGFLMTHMPVPQRHEGKSGVAAAPSYELPPEVTNLKLAKRFIADRFGVLPEMVFKLGESYFSYIGMTPQKIHPFAVAAPPEMFKDSNIEFFNLLEFNRAPNVLKRDPHLMLTIGRSYKAMHGHIKAQMKYDARATAKAEVLVEKGPDWGLPVDYIDAPTGAGDEEKAENTSKTVQPKAKVTEPGGSEAEKSNTKDSALTEASKKQEPKPERW